MFFPIVSYAKGVPTRWDGKLLNLRARELLSTGNAALMRAMLLTRCPSPANVPRSEVFARFGGVLRSLGSRGAILAVSAKVTRVFFLYFRLGGKSLSSFCIALSMFFWFFCGSLLGVIVFVA